MNQSKIYIGECKLCGKVFKTHTGKKEYCGSTNPLKRTGCSYMNHLRCAREANRKRRGYKGKEDNKTV